MHSLTSRLDALRYLGREGNSKGRRKESGRERRSPRRTMRATWCRRCDGKEKGGRSKEGLRGLWSIFWGFWPREARWRPRRRGHAWSKGSTGSRRCRCVYWKRRSRREMGRRRTHTERRGDGESKKQRSDGGVLSIAPLTLTTTISLTFVHPPPFILPLCDLLFSVHNLSFLSAR